MHIYGAKARSTKCVGTVHKCGQVDEMNRNIYK